MPVPTALDETHQKMLDKLRGLNGSDFTKQYIDDQVSGHKDAVSLFQRYAKGGRNEKLKSWAASHAADAAAPSRHGAGLEQQSRRLQIAERR